MRIYTRPLRAGYLATAPEVPSALGRAALHLKEHFAQMRSAAGRA